MVCILAGLIVLPILTYTVLAKNRAINIKITFALPLIAGTLVGLLLIAWIRMHISAFVLSCTFIGASEIAPVISEWINRFLFAVTGDLNYLFDPIDLFFALFKVELADHWMFISRLILMDESILTKVPLMP